MGTAATLIFGVGNPQRGDDAVGPMVIDSLRERLDPEKDRVEMRVLSGDLVDLGLSWHSDQDVVIVDAMVGGGSPGTIAEFDGLDGVPLGQGTVSSHTIGIAEAVELARLLNRLPRSLTIISVEGLTFQHFDPPSTAVAASIPLVVDRLVERCGTMTGEMDL